MKSGTMESAAKAYELGRYEAALILLNDEPDLLGNLAAVDLLADCMARLGMVAQAIEVFEAHLDLDPEWHHVFLKKAAILSFALNDRERAERLASRMLKHEPNSPDASFILLHVLEGARARLQRETFIYNLIGSDVPAHLELAHRLLGDNRANSRLLPLFRKLAALKPEDAGIRSTLMEFAREYADYDTLDALAIEEAEGRAPKIFQFAMDHLMTHGDERVPLENVHLAISAPMDAAIRARRRTARHDWGERLRIGYISADFRPDHVVMRQLVDILRQHDRKKVDVTLFSNAGPISAEQAGYFAGLGQYVDLSAMPDEQAAEEIHRRRIDIAVELGGHTSHSRASLFNLGVAPLQVSWLGYPGSAVGIDSDYVIGDRIVTPESSAPYFGEKFCWMPDSYMPNDPTGRPLPQEVSRAALGLPTDRFVFASFNAPKKVTPEVIATWAEILLKAPDSVLWMACRTTTAEQNVRKRLEALSVAASRVVFAPAPRSHDEHILRMRAADLVLDTFPYNGHATTADCLWAGVPVLAVKGGNFSGRVSESQLSAIDLPELIASDRDDYVARAVALAADPARLGRYRARLDRNRLHLPLFDSERYCRHLETAYAMMAARARQRLEPAHLAVPALPVREADFLPHQVRLAG